MDRLSEIRARCEAATREEYPEKVYGSAAYYCVTKDIPYLLEEVKQARAERDHIKLSNDGLCVSHDNLYARLREATARAEKAEAERDAIKDDFQDFATSGIYNMNPYCSNRCADCTDGRGWCIENRCKGFYVALPEPPKGE